MKVYVVMYNLFSLDESESFGILDSVWNKEEDARKYCNKYNNGKEYDPDVEYSHFYKEMEVK